MAEAGVLFATPRMVTRLEDCDFYHTIEIPGSGLVEGQWDLRGMVDQYLGGVSFAGKRVIEIGPASGFLTVEMEKRGADVVAIEVPDDPGWDFVPYPASAMASIQQPRRVHMERIKNSFWLTHNAFHSNAQLVYADARRLPAALGAFDVAVMASILLHCQSPLEIVEQCAMRSKLVVIADRYFPELEGKPLCRLVPTSENFVWDTWWQFSPDFFLQFLRVLGFSHLRTSTYIHRRWGALFTITAAKDGVFDSEFVTHPDRVSRLRLAAWKLSKLAAAAELKLRKNTFLKRWIK